PAALLALQFVALAAGKPGEYGRFAIYVDIVLAIVAAALLARLGRSARYTLPLLLATVIWCGLPYQIGFCRDAWVPQTTRIAAAETLAALSPESIAIYSVP